MNIKALYEKYEPRLQSLKTESRLVTNIFKEFGPKHFGRPLLLGGLAIMICYSGIYSPARSRLGRLNKLIDSAKTNAQYADQYRDLRDRLAPLYARIPDPGGRNGWLINAIMQSMKAEGIVSEAIPATEEKEQSGLVLQKVNVPVIVKFPQLISWFNRLATVKPEVQILSLHLQKKDQAPGINQAHCAVSVIVPARGLDQ